MNKKMAKVIALVIVAAMIVAPVISLVSAVL